MKEDDIPLFLAFCIEQYKRAHKLNGYEAMTELSRTATLDYLANNYEVLHTQSPEWILNEIEEFIAQHHKA